MAKPKIIAVVGPNASGKSALAVRLAKKFSGEIISADSRQVYRGLNLGSGKVPRDKAKSYKLKAKSYFHQGVPHHLLNVASPRRTFTAAQYQRLAEKKIQEILRRNRVPIICGGTGFYIKAVIDGLNLPPVPPDPKLRAELARETPDGLFARIRKLDPERAEKIDRNNPRRLIRAIEIATALGRVPRLNPAEPPYDFLQIGLKTQSEKLKTKIRRRLNARLRQGLIAEVRKLRQSGLSWRRLDNFGLEYRFISRYLRDALTRQEMLKQLETAIWHYAKRQMTWFKKDKRIKWVKNYAEAGKLVRAFL